MNIIIERVLVFISSFIDIINLTRINKSVYHTVNNQKRLEWLIQCRFRPFYNWKNSYLKMPLELLNTNHMHKLYINHLIHSKHHLINENRTHMF